MADGVDGYSELEAGETLIAAALRYPAAFNALMQTPWVQDDITHDEAEVIYRLHALIRDADTSLRQEVIRKAVEMLSMPFLESVQSHDALAVRSLYQERYRGDRSAEFLRLMAHPALGEITDDEAKVVLLLAGTSQHQPWSAFQLLDTLVSGEGIYVEERTVNLRYSGQITLAIIRHLDRATPSASMEGFEHAIRTIDDFMGWPVHTNRVTLYFGQSTSGYHYGTHITSSPAVDDEDYGTGYRTVAHETGHLFWTSRGTHWIDKSTPPWMKEGAAEFLTIIAENVRIGRPMDAKRSPCQLDNIRDLEIAKFESGTPANFCLYSLGQRLFLDLYHSLGEGAFREGFRNLYLKRLRSAPDDGCDRHELGICHVRHAFRSVASPGAADKVNGIIARWYDGTEPYDLSRLDHRPVDPNMASIDGQVTDAFLSLDPSARYQPGSRTNRVSLATLKKLERRIYVHWQVTFPPAAQRMDIPMTTAAYHEDGFIFERSRDYLDIRVGDTDDWETDGIGSSDPDRWAIGQYGVYIYDGDRKVAQVEFEIVP